MTSDRRTPTPDRAPRRISIILSLFSCTACAATGAPVRGPQAGIPEAAQAVSAPPRPVDAVCSGVPASAAVRFSQFLHFAPVWPVHVGGVVLRLHGSTAALAPLMGELGIQGVLTHPCPGESTLVWIPGAAADGLPALFSARGLQVEETVVFDPAEGRAWLAQCKANAGDACVRTDPGAAAPP